MSAAPTPEQRRLAKDCMDKLSASLLTGRMAAYTAVWRGAEVIVLGYMKGQGTTPEDVDVVPIALVFDDRMLEEVSLEEHPGAWVGER